jgi:HEAT repeat protein
MKWPEDALERAAAAAGLGLRRPVPAGTGAALRELLGADPDPRVRAAALGALVRVSKRRAAGPWAAALADPDPSVRRRAAEAAPEVAPTDCSGLVEALGDPDPSVAEAAAFALGELGPQALAAGAVNTLSSVAASHSDPLVREAAVAALGSLGHPDGLAAVLAACSDRPAVRRRAVIALAAFTGPEVEAALRTALDDRDWQVRQAAEDLTGAAPAGTGGWGRDPRPHRDEPPGEEP